MKPDAAVESPRACTLDEVLDLARARTRGPGRWVLGIAGAPGCGKSTTAAQIVEAAGESAVVVPMDGFHLTDSELGRLGRHGRKGAPDTFDVAGYVSVLKRLRSETHHTVYAPAFDRSAETSLAGAIAVRPEHRLVITEGNYLLLDAPGWNDVRALLDESWFLRADESTRMARLVQRHVAHGKQPAAAQEWAAGSDQANAELVARTWLHADVVVDVV